LKETYKIFSDRRSSLLAEGKRVIDGQLGIADEDKRKQSYLAKFMRNAAGNAENLLGQYEEEVRAEWHKERLKYLETADEWPNGRVVHAGKYDRMFEPTREKIREILTTEFPKLEASARAQETAQRGTSAETGDRTGGGAGRGTGTGTGTGPGEKRTSETSAQCTYSVCLPAAIVPLAERLSPAGLLALTLLLAVCLGGVVGAVAFRGVQRWRRG
jgi:hypothetical protein